MRVITRKVGAITKCRSCRKSMPKGDEAIQMRPYNMTAFHVCMSCANSMATTLKSLTIGHGGKSGQSPPDSDDVNLFLEG